MTEPKHLLNLFLEVFYFKDKILELNVRYLFSFLVRNGILAWIQEFKSKSLHYGDPDYPWYTYVAKYLQRGYPRSILHLVVKIFLTYERVLNILCLTKSTSLLIFGAFNLRGGKGIIALSSTYTDKDATIHSRIVPTLRPGSIVTVPRSCVQCVATEFGITQLKGKSTWQRAEALIGIANPAFRDELTKKAREMKIWFDQAY